MGGSVGAGGIAGGVGRGQIFCKRDCRMPLISNRDGRSRRPTGTPSKFRVPSPSMSQPWCPPPADVPPIRSTGPVTVVGSSGMRGSWLSHVTVQAPASVWQAAPMSPYSVVKVIPVPSGTGLLKASAARRVTSVVTPSSCQPPGFRVSTARLKELLSGRPVLRARSLETVEISLPATVMVAMTRTGVGTAPALTVKTTSPIALLVTVAVNSPSAFSLSFARVRPPKRVDSRAVTG